MLSRFLKYIIPPFTFRVFFRRIFYSNLKKVPLEKPLLFVGNHQNSFMDGVLVGSYLPQPIHFTMRADMFRKPFARFCLRELNVSPVYRIEEGLENVHKNLETFTGIYEILRNNGNFIMFSEGTCVQEKRLQKLRKGTARLAFGAEEKFGLDVNIVPVGINYTYPAKFRKEVMINFGDPFSIRELKDIYQAHPAKALLAFNEKCDASLRKEVIIIEAPGNDSLAEHLLIMERNNMVLPFFQWRFDKDDRRIMEKKIADKINHLSKSSAEETRLLNEKVIKYAALLKTSRLKDENFARKLDWGFLRYFALIAGFPLFLAGYISNLIPFIVPKFICDKLIKDPRFYSSVYISSGTVLYLIYFPVLLILAAIFAGWTGFLLCFFVPLLGYIVLFYREIFWERFYTLRYNIKSIANRSLIDNLNTRRQEISNILDNISII
ncbi:MAG: 1-acyl-sn-glycerol-3-phosphate acyltransferase [Bacteroidales bacterium]|jgi:1-acyl-sn-glycerol-3-phosphate acyltransferase|nr:1-acyl-sn-glycerol-3-phosphate acyltransferase [Bacteroidales bacterium]